MSLIQRISAVALSAAAVAGMAASGCGAQDPEASPAPASTAVVEHLDVGDGVQIELKHDDAIGLMSISMIGPESAKARMAELAKVQGGASELYAAALPNAEIPASVAAFDAMTHLATEVVIDTGAVPPSIQQREPTADLRLDRVSKSASTFPGQFCGSSSIDQVCARSGWYAVKNACYTTVTGDWSLQLNTVRQGFAALEMQVGTANLKSWWWNGTAWVVNGDVPVPQGFQYSTRLWQSNSIPAYYTFAVVGAAGDTYHLAIQSADTPITDMANKTVGGTQKYRIRCGCTSAGGAVTQKYVDKCLNQPTGVISGREQPTHNQSYGQCQLACLGVPGTIASTDNTSFQALPNTAGCAN